MSFSFTSDSVSIINPCKWTSENETLFESLPNELRHIILHYDASFHALSSHSPTPDEIKELILDKIFLEESLYCSIPDPSMFNEGAHPDKARCFTYQEATAFGYDDLDYSRLCLALSDRPTWAERIWLLGTKSISSIVSARYDVLGFKDWIVIGKEAALYTLDDIWHRYHFLYPVITREYLKFCADELEIEVEDHLDINRLYKTIRSVI